MRQQLHVSLFQNVNRCCCRVRTGIVMVKKKARESRLWEVLVPKRRRLSGDNDARTSPQWLSVCPQEDRWRHGPNFRSNKQPFSYVRSMIFLVSLFFLSLSFFFFSFFLRGWGEGVTCPETARPLTANWFPDHVDRSKFRNLSELCVNI